MKKYLVMILRILLFLSIAAIVFWSMFTLCFKVLIKNSIVGPLFQNYGFIVQDITFLLIVVIFAVIFKITKESLVKTCNFAKINLKNLFLILFIGIFMAVFTLSFVYINYVMVKFPALSNYVDSFSKMPYSNLLIFIGMVPAFFCEEIIFRGVIYNELRKGMSVTLAVIIGALIYGYTNILLNMDWTVGVYAIFAGISYTLVYVWTRSLWGNILVQIISFEAITIPLKSSWRNYIMGRTDGTLLLYAMIGMLGMIIGYYFLWRSNSLKQNTTTKNLPV